MSKVKFTKMHGCGNDYIFFDCTKGLEIANPSVLSPKLSNRNFGIGGDGIVLIKQSSVADAYMQMFNADGSEGAMCGNAIRCVASYLEQNNMPYSNIETLSGIKHITKNGSDWQVDMGAPTIFPDIELNILGKDYTVNIISMGNPHAVVFCEHIDGLDLGKIGPLFEHHPAFPDRTNTEFVEFVGYNHYKMRVWERGSGETLACGTGACAAAAALVKNCLANYDDDIKIELLGGILTINRVFNNEKDTVFMTGNAIKAYEGEIYL